MTDSMNPEQVITIEVTRMELSSFVCYMRELDKQYRYLSTNVKPAKVSVTDDK